MNVFEEIKTKLNIVEVINDYVQVKSVGATYKCLCPFHKDKNPSLVISPEKGLWHCFGCGQGGDMFKFVMDFENISKKEALERLAKKASVDLKQYQTKATLSKDSKDDNQDIKKDENQESEYEIGLRYLQWVKDVYHKVLLKLLNDRQNVITKYCLERNLSQQTIEDFQVGYAPGGDFILKLAQKHKLDLEVLEKIGVLKIVEAKGYNSLNDDKILKQVQNDSSKQKSNDQNKQSNKDESREEIKNYKDKFTDRLMIPVFSKTGQVVGFTGRVLPHDTSGRPRYLNSSQTNWFNKSDIWFGWNLNQKNIRQKKEAIIVEGNMDVIASYQNGLKNVLASQGTSFTSGQLKNLKYLTSKIVLAFDNDEAGISSSRKFFKEATSMGFLVQKLMIPKNYKDLDQWLNTIEDKNNLENHLKTKDFIEYAILDEETFLKSTDLQTQKQAILKILDLLSVTDQLTTEHYLNQLSAITKKSYQALTSEFKKLKLNQVYLPITSQLQKTEIIKDKDTLVTFQNFIAEKTNNPELLDKQTHAEKTRFENLFLLLRVLEEDLKEYENLESYLASQKEILALIYDENKKKEVDFEKLEQILLQKINDHYSEFLLDENLTSSYLSIYNQ